MNPSNRYTTIEAVVYCLVVFPECHYIVNHIFGCHLFDKNTCYEVCNGFHLRFFHSQARDFGSPYTQSAWMIPVFWLIGRDQVLVRDDVSSCQSLCHLQPTAKLAHISYHLMRSRKSFVCS